MGGFGHEQRRADVAEQFRRGLAEFVEQGLHFEGAGHVGVAAAIHRVARERGFLHHREVVGQASGGVQPGDVGARGHQAFRGAVAQAHDPVHHVALVEVDHALLVAFAHQQLDFLLGDAVAGVVADAEQAQHAAVDRAQQQDDGFRRGGQRVERDGDPAGDGLRIGQRQPLRDQFAEDHRAGSDQRDRGADADRACVLRGVRPDMAQPVGDLQADGVAAEHAGADADQGDADLYRRQQVVRLFGQRQCLACAAAGAVRILGQLLQTQLARGHHRHLRHREEAVERDQGEDDQQLSHGRSRPARRWGGRGGKMAMAWGNGSWGAPERSGMIAGRDAAPAAQTAIQPS